MALFTLKQLEDARKTIYQIMQPTPQYRWGSLSDEIGAEVWVKHENHTPTGAFKVRGGLVYMAEIKDRIDQGEAISGVISATRGNHGQSLAFASARLGLKAVICVPEGNSGEQNAAIERHGAELIIHGKDFDETRIHAADLAEKRGLHMVPPFHPTLVRGVASYAAELFEAVKGLDRVYVGIGMGSGICGLITVRDLMGLDTEIVGVVSTEADAYAQSFAVGHVVTTETANTIADGVACREPHPDAFSIVKHGAARILRVSDAEAERGIRNYHYLTHNMAEGAAGLVLAGAYQERELNRNKKIGVIHCGANIDADTYARIIMG